MRIREFTASDIESVRKFADRTVGLGYYTTEELIENQKQSVASSGEICSFILEDDHGHICGLRLAYPPGNWQHGKGSQLRADLWPTPLNRTAYFQSLFVSPELRGGGWGPQLSKRSLQVLKQLGAEGVVAHSWKESPQNSSMRYLEKMGFIAVAEHPDYWVNVDYICPRDGKPCHCTAVEMHLDLRESRQ